MKCLSCKKNIVRSLELYDGSWACPHCGKPVLEIPESFSYTQENQEQYVLSECLYLQYLTEGKSLTQAEADKKLDKAIELCRLSAKNGNPFATVRMGYFYDKDYLGITDGEVKRCKMAYSYYAAVCFHTEDPKKDASMGLKVRIEDFGQLRKRAGRMLLEMLSQAPDALTAIKAYNFKDNQNRVRAAVGEDFGVSADTQEIKKRKSEEQLFDLLFGCATRDRAPMFGISYLKGSEVQELFRIKRTGAKKDVWDAYRMIEKDYIELYFAPCNANRAISERDGFRRFSYRDSIDGMVFGDGDNPSEIEPDKTYCLYYFNDRLKNKPQYLSKKDVASVAQTLEPFGDTEWIRSLANDGGRTDYALYEDDVFVLVKQKHVGAGEAAGDLIDIITKGEHQ